jgi:hypothetical protein
MVKSKEQKVKRKSFDKLRTGREKAKIKRIHKSGEGKRQ